MGKLGELQRGTRRQGLYLGFACPRRCPFLSPPRGSLAKLRASIAAVASGAHSVCACTYVRVPFIAGTLEMPGAGSAGGLGERGRRGHLWQARAGARVVRQVRKCPRFSCFVRVLAVYVIVYFNQTNAI